MELDGLAADRWNKCKSFFDLAALCYDLIMEKLGDTSDAVFISQYFDKGKDGSCSNPNLQKLYMLINDTKVILDREPIPEEQIEEIWTSMEKTAKDISLFGDEKGSLASIYFAVLKGIDLHVDFRRKNGDVFPSSGPLNHADNANSLVYFRSNNVFLEQVKEKCGYRSGVSAGGIGETLNAILNIEKKQLFSRCGYPCVKPLEIHEGRILLKRQLKEERKIKIAVFPDGKPAWFAFDEKSTPGSSFCINYPEGQDEVISRHCRWLEKAVGAGAHFIIFPEFFVSPELLDGIKQWIKENADKKWMRESALLAVFAGTTWTKDHNNVLHILDHRGSLLGTYYKYSPFRKLPDNESQQDAYDMCEYLTQPGKKSILLDIEGVGRILSSICRDIIDGEYTDKLVKNYEPFLLVTSAYSSSVVSFKRHYDAYASCYYVTSVLCNACDAVKLGNKLGMCTVPRKVGSEMRQCTKDIWKCKEWNKDCLESCCIMVELDFGDSGEIVRDGHPIVRYRRLA